jgi:hypothetical protein
MSNPIIVPPEVNAILDEGDESGPYGVSFTISSVQLIDKDGNVVREVHWPQAGEFARNILKNSLIKLE